MVRALALRSGDPGFKTRFDHSLNLIGSPWFNFPAALVNREFKKRRRLRLRQRHKGNNIIG